jgi:hypothetical protein
MRLRRDAIALLLGASAACGPPPVPARPAPELGRVVYYQPLAMVSDARRPELAVFLATDEANGSTVLRLPAVAAPVVVDAMAMLRSEGGAASADMQAIVLTGAPRLASSPGVAGPSSGTATSRHEPAGGASAGSASTDAASAGGASAGVASAGGASVGSASANGAPVQVTGVADGAAGARWRADAWLAAQVAAAAIGKDLADVVVSATPSGPIDGPASALVATGLVAALLGGAIDPSATLAGAIEPDGSISAVAGLPEQVATAIEHGKTRIGYPAGMRIARSTAGKDVDLVQLARGRHAEAIELADLHDAYRLLTRRALPAPVAVGAAAMALEPAAQDQIAARYLVWQRKLADEWAALLQLEQAGRLPAPVAVLVRVAHHRSERAEALHRAGRHVAAYRDVMAAWLHAAAANRTHAVIDKLAAGDANGAWAALAALDPGDAELRAVFERIGGRTPTTLAAHLATAAALEAALRSWAFHDQAVASLRAAAQQLGQLGGVPPTDLGSPVTAESVAAMVVPAVLRLLRAGAEAALAEQELELAPEGGAAYRCAPAELARVAAALQGVAAATLGHADALVVEPLAHKAGITVEAARTQVAERDADYLIADRLGRTGATGLPYELAAAWGEASPGAALLALTAARAAYHASARAIARHEALGVRSDDTGRVEAVAHPPVFRALVITAERTARAAARMAQVATGAIPVQSRLAYQIATLAAAGSVDDQVDALAAFWAATAASETAVILARH